MQPQEKYEKIQEPKQQLQQLQQQKLKKQQERVQSKKVTSQFKQMTSSQVIVNKRTEKQVQKQTASEIMTQNKFKNNTQVLMNGSANITPKDKSVHSLNKNQNQHSCNSKNKDLSNYSQFTSLQITHVDLEQSSEQINLPYTGNQISEKFDRHQFLKEYLEQQRIQDKKKSENGNQKVKIQQISKATDQPNQLGFYHQVSGNFNQNSATQIQKLDKHKISNNDKQQIIRCNDEIYSSVSMGQNPQDTNQNQSIQDKEINQIETTSKYNKAEVKLNQWLKFFNSMTFGYYEPNSKIIVGELICLFKNLIQILDNKIFDVCYMSDQQQILDNNYQDNQQISDKQNQIDLNLQDAFYKNICTLCLLQDHHDKQVKEIVVFQILEDFLLATYKFEMKSECQKLIQIMHDYLKLIVPTKQQSNSIKLLSYFQLRLESLVQIDMKLRQQKQSMDQKIHSL